MIAPPNALAVIPSELRKPLLSEYKSIIQNYMERKWSPSELSGGKFCEIVYTIIDGYAKSRYPSRPMKPSRFVDACKQLESNTHVPRSFQILIPRLLPALYEIRNNRGVGHVGGDVDPNHMDATAVVSFANWILAELVRVFHDLSIEEAQQVVDSLAERKIPIVWSMGDVKRVLDTSISLEDQILLLVASSPTPVDCESLFEWLDYNNISYLNRLIRSLHKRRFLEFNSKTRVVQILPPGSHHVEKLVKTKYI